jgi:hypothetical protein
MGRYRAPLGWERAQFPTLLFFKPGYEPKGLGRTDWEYGEDYSVPRTEPTRIFRKVGWQREIPLYPYLTRPLTEIEAADPGQKLRNDAERIFAGLRPSLNSLRTMSMTQAPALAKTGQLMRSGARLSC